MSKVYTEELALQLTELLLNNDKLIQNDLIRKIEKISGDFSISLSRTDTDNGSIITIKNGDTIQNIVINDGKNVQVAKIEPIIGGNRVTFSYTSDDGITQTSSMEVMNGEAGTSIVNAKIVSNNVLILELSDGSIINAGQIVVNADSLTLDDYYTIEQTDKKFVQKLELDTLIQNYLDSTFIPIESEDIHKLF